MVLFYSILSISAQNKKSWSSTDYTLKRKSLAEMAALADKSQADHNTYCLIRYHNERKTGLFVGLGAVALGFTSLYMKDQPNNYYVYTDSRTHITTKTQLAFMKTNAGWTAVGAGLAALVSLGFYIDAEEWISRNRLVFSSDGLAYRF